MPSLKHIAALLLLAAAASCSQQDQYRRIEGFAQGGTFHIIYSAPSSETASAVDENSVMTLVSNRLHDIDFSISGYNKGSLLSRFNRGEDIVPDRYFLELFRMSMELWKETGGLFDVSGGPLFDFWGFGFKDPASLDSLRNDARTARTVDSLLEFVGMDLLSLENGQIIRKDPRVTLNFNAIAQGYTCDVVADLLDSLGVENYLVEVGMEIVCKGLNASGRPWRIGIDAPVDGSQVAGENVQKLLDLTDCGITTSGNYRKFFILDGKKYSHSINPVTGYPVQHDLLSATVISIDTARSGAFSDAYATYCMVLGKDASARFIGSRGDLRGYLIYDGGVIDMLKDGSEIHTSYGRVEEYPQFESAYMSPRQVYVWLPDGYSPRKKYPVLYMHDGQMLFDDTWTWNGQEWEVDEVLGRLIADGKIPPVIVVGIAHGDNRYGEYFPEKVLGYLGAVPDSLTGGWYVSSEDTPDGMKNRTDKQTAARRSQTYTDAGDAAKLDPVSGPGPASASAALDYMLASGAVYEADEYLRFLTSELKPFIDSHYSTMPDRQHTFVAGSSMGGLISLYALCEYPDVFGGAACMSTHLPMITSASYSSAADVSQTVFEAFMRYLSDHLPAPGSHLLYTDRGDGTLDALYPPFQDRLDSLLSARGWRPGPSLPASGSGAPTSFAGDNRTGGPEAAGSDAIGLDAIDPDAIGSDTTSDTIDQDAIDQDAIDPDTIDPDTIDSTGTWISPVFPGASHVEHDWAARLHVPFTFLLR